MFSKQEITMKKFIMILIFLFSMLYPQNRLNNQPPKTKNEKIVVGSLDQKRVQQVPRQISYQGLITRADGSPTSDGSYEILFKLYDTPDGGEPVWTENLEVTVNNGIISTILGKINPFSVIPDESYLELTVDGSTLSPRQSLTSVFYSVLSDTSSYARSANYDNLSNLPDLDVYVLKDSLESYTTSEDLFDTLSSYQQLDSNLTDLVEDGVLSASKIEYGITSEGDSGKSWISDGLGSGVWGTPTALAADDIIPGDGNINIQTSLGGINIDPSEGSTILFDSTISIENATIGTIDDNDLIELKPDTITIAGTVVATSIGGDAVLDEDDMASDSDTQLATQQSIKAYIDTKQDADENLETISDLEQQDGNFIVSDGTGWTVESDSIARNSLGLGNIATQNIEEINIDGGSIDGTVIGSTSPETGNFSTINAGDGATIGDLTLNSGIITDNEGTISFDDENLITTGTISAETGSTIGRLTLSDGSVTDSGGNISFGDENLSTTGTFTAGISNLASATTIGDLTLANGTITDESGTISFGGDNLSTAGTLDAGVATFQSGSEIGDITISDGSIASSSDEISFGNDAIVTSGTLTAGVTSLEEGSTIGSVTVEDGSITDSGGSISFGDENLSTTGTFSAGQSTIGSGSSIGSITIADGSITDSGTDGLISFGDENLSTSGTLNAGVSTFASGSNIGNLTLSDGSIIDSDGAITFGDENLSTTGSVTASSFAGDGSNLTGVEATSTGVLAGNSPIILEGETADDFQTTLSLVDPTSDQIITLPNVTGTIITTDNDTSINEVGTIGSGIWQGTAVANEYVAENLTVVAGTIDNTIIGGSTPAAGEFTTLSSSSASIGTISASDGSITDSGGAITFGDENLSTTGTVTSGAQTVTGNLTASGTVSAEQLTSTDDLTVDDEASIDGTMTIATGSITDLSGAITFGDENLSTTGTVTS
ncbi:MAG: hypothetical protein CMA12_08900, partial [Euryarchaeota archaeon]|nr:hypothetical protein [Euryarchaeota archaeon]